MNLTKKEQKWLLEHAKDLPSVDAGTRIGRKRFLVGACESPQDGCLSLETGRGEYAHLLYEEDDSYPDELDTDDWDSGLLDQRSYGVMLGDSQEAVVDFETLSLAEEIDVAESELKGARRTKDSDRAWLEHRLKRLKEQFRKSTGMSFELWTEYDAIMDEFVKAQLIAAGLSLAERKAMWRHQLGEDQKTIARKLRISQPAVSRALKNGKAKLESHDPLSFEQFLREKYTHVL